MDGRFQEAFKDGAWRAEQRQGYSQFSAPSASSGGSDGKRTVVDLFGELVVLQQRSHLTAGYAAQDVLHLGSLLAQPKVKIPEPEDLVESRGDVGCEKKWKVRA